MRGGGLSAPGDGGDDADLVVGRDRGGQVVHEADVFVIDVHVDVLLQLAPRVENPLVEVRVAGAEVGEDLSHGVPLRIHLGEVARVGTERGGDADDGHRFVSFRVNHSGGNSA